MKDRCSLLLILIAILLALSLVGCGLLPVSIEQRIQLFEDSLNGLDRLNTYQNLHPDSPAYSATNGTTITWDLKFPTPDIPFEITGLPADPVSVATGVQGTISGLAYGPYPIKFQMELLNGTDWRIWDIELDETGGGYVSIFGL